MKTVYKPFLFASILAVTAFAGHSLKAAEQPDKEAVRQIVKEYLTEHPEIVVDALNAYQAQEVEREAAKFKDAMKTKQNDLTGAHLPFAGNPDGDVVIVEFFDYNCGYCKRALMDLQNLIKKDDKVKVIFHDIPILSESSHDAARYALAAHKQGKYFDFHQTLMRSSGAKNVENLEKIAGDLGLDVEKLRTDANSPEIAKEIESNLDLSRELGIRGTPAFIIGDDLMPGYITLQEMQKLVEKVRKDAKG